MNEYMEMWSSSYTLLDKWLKPIFNSATTGVAVHSGALETPTIMSMNTAPLLFVSNIGIPHRIHLKKSFQVLF